jgi:hypothetical protein
LILFKIIIVLAYKKYFKINIVLLFQHDINYYFSIFFVDPPVFRWGHDHPEFGWNIGFFFFLNWGVHRFATLCINTNLKQTTMHNLARLSTNDK